MNQEEATELFAEGLASQGFESVTIGRAVEGDHPDVIIVSAGGVVLSVTVEILAQP